MNKCKVNISLTAERVKNENLQVKCVPTSFQASIWFILVYFDRLVQSTQNWISYVLSVVLLCMSSILLLTE